MRTLLSLMALMTVGLLSGCQCCSCTEHYADKIDDISYHFDNKKGLDNFYCERLDPTRWCMNRPCPPGRCYRCR